MTRRRQRWGVGLCVWLVLIAALAGAAGCAEDLRDDPFSPEQIWGAAQGERTGVDEPLDFRPRATDCAAEPQGCYGLPRPGEASIADLIALLPARAPQNSAPDLYVAPGVEVSTDQCRSDGPAVVEGLPLVIEAVVTLYPRRYLKPTVCGQDERNYGVFTIEDDTGGILVLRNSRVAPYTFGDRVRITVSGVVFTSRYDVDSRAILIADIEPLPTPEVVDEATGERHLVRPVLYTEKADERFKVFSYLDVAQVKRIEGYVHGEPTNANFGNMTMTSRLVNPASAETLVTDQACAGECLRRCLPGCGTDTDLTYASDGAVEACKDICAEECVDGEFAVADLPACWLVGVDSEITRRNNTYKPGEHLRVTGPVVNSYDYQIWTLSLGQLERLPD
jgi:hypothetical protein